MTAIFSADEHDAQSWHRLAPVWQSDIDELDSGVPALNLSPVWNLLLLSDGSVTRHLQVLSGEPTQINLIDMSPIGDSTDGAPGYIQQINGPRMRRQVWLHNSFDAPLAYASSWWDASLVDAYLKNKSLPIWASLAAQKAELYRQILCVQQGHSEALENAFGCPGPFWGRYYFFWHDQKPLTLIYEVFSPRLQCYLERKV